MIDYEDLRTRWRLGRSWPRRTWRRLRKLATWAPVIWGDVDWDYSSLYLVMLTKVRGMRVAHEGYHSTAEPGRSEVIQQMRTTEEALARLLADDYLGEEWDALVDEVYPEGVGEVMKVTEAGSERIRSLSGRQDALQEADRAVIGKAMKEWAHGWWD